MERDPLPLDRSGNGSRIRSIEFDEADAYMLAQAMLIAANTALVSGSGQPKLGMRRLLHYRELFLSFAPPSAKLMNDECDLCEIAIAMSSEPSWTIHRVREREWSRTFRVVVSVGKLRWKSDSLVGDEEFSAIAEMVEAIAPISCIKQDRPDSIGSPWA